MKNNRRKKYKEKQNTIREKQSNSKKEEKNKLVQIKVKSFKK